jgi:RNA polymerase sigma factor (sigma-70 family)
LLRHVADGDSAAFWEVWNIHRNYLYSICLREMSGIRADAEDALSRVMIKAWSRLPEHASRITNLKAWLARLTRNFCVDIHRERRRQTHGLENIEEMGDADYASLAHQIPTPEEMVLQRELRLHLKGLIEDLPPSLSQPFMLRFFHGISYVEIAVRLNLSNDNVRKRIQQARSLLRGQLGGRQQTELHPIARPFRGSPDAARPRPLPSSRAPGWTRFEIRSEGVAARLVNVMLQFRRELSFELVLDHAPETDSVESLDAYVRTRGGGWEERWDKACRLYETGRWEDAAGVLRAVLESQPRMLDAHLLLGKILCSTGQEDGAGDVYESALRAATENASRHHIGGLMKVCQRRYRDAVEDFRRAAKLEPNNPAHWNCLGEAHLLAGSHLGAIQAFEESLKVMPDGIVALARSRDALLTAGRAKEAEERAERVLELDRESVPNLKWMADRCSLAGGEEGNRKAQKLIASALLLAPEAAEVHESLAVQYIARGELERGLCVLRAFVERKPRSVAGWLAYARWLSRTGAQSAAAENVMKAYELHPTGRETLELSCELLARVGEVTRLTPLVVEMLARFPDCWNVWAVAARAILSCMGDAERACALAAEGTRLQPRLSAAWTQYGRVLALAGKREEGIKALERGWKCPHDGASDDLVAAVIRLGESYRLLGREGRARAWFEKAAQMALALAALSPSLAHYRQGQALDALGDTVGAMQSYRAALDGQLFYPKRRAAKRNLRLLQGRVRPCAAR